MFGMDVPEEPGPVPVVQPASAIAAAIADLDHEKPFLRKYQGAARHRRGRVCIIWMRRTRPDWGVWSCARRILKALRFTSD